MACGLCCIVSDIPVLRENFSGAVHFADPEDPEAFAESALHYLKNENDRVKMGHAARHLAQSFDWKYVARTEAHIIRSTVNRLKPIS